MNRIQDGEGERKVIGLIPAGGHAKRITPLPCSKELYPIGFRTVDNGRSQRPKVVCHYLLEKMKCAGVDRAFIVLRNGKWDVPAYFEDGAIVNMELAYLVTKLPFGPPYTLDQAYPFVRDALVVFGFPDILFQPDDVFAQLLARQAATHADIVLGLFPAVDPQQMDMVELDEQGRVRSMIIQPPKTPLHYGWICAAWTPVFTCFMHEYLATIPTAKLRDGASGHETARLELSVGAVIQAAVQERLRVEGVPFQGGTYLDIGTPDDLVKASRAEGVIPAVNSSRG